MYYIRSRWSYFQKEGLTIFIYICKERKKDELWNFLKLKYFYTYLILNVEKIYYYILTKKEKTERKIRISFKYI